MDLNEMRNQVKKVKAPREDQKISGNRSVEELIAAVKVEDARDNKQFRRSKVFFLAAGVIYVAIFLLTFIAPPDNSPNLHRMILSLFAFVFLSLAMYSRMKSRRLTGLDYAAPASAFLENVEKRYRIVRIKGLMFVIPYLLILVVTCDLASKTAMERYFPSLEPKVGTVLTAVYFVIVLIVALLLGWKDWKRRKEPLLREAREMRIHLSNENQ
jgi:drug/metabolite transporter (DMT)-like permease